MSEVRQSLPGWSSRPLIDLADYFNGAAFKPKDWGKDGLPIIRIEQLNNPEAETDKYSGALLPSNYIDTGDLIFSWSATLKVLIWKSGPGALNQHLYKVVPKAGIDKLLLLHLLDFNMEKLAGQSQGSTMRHVTRKELSRFRVKFPSDENIQQRISLILQTIDQAIEKTEALIEKYQQIKAGLMHDLFTRGIGADGKLRPPREQTPELYQETPIGWIPKEWDALPLGELISYISYGFTNPMPTTKDGPFMITAANIFDGKVQYETARRTSRRDFQRLLTSKSKPQVGDILLTKDGTLGRVAIVDVDGICINQSVAVMRPNGICETSFMLHLLESDKYQKAMLDDAGGSTIKHIYITVIDKMLVAIPRNAPEQTSISQILTKQNIIIEAENTRLTKLRNQKSGLMHDLLTGKVPVKVEPPETAHV